MVLGECMFVCLSVCPSVCLSATVSDCLCVGVCVCSQRADGSPLAGNKVSHWSLSAYTCAHCCAVRISSTRSRFGRSRQFHRFLTSVLLVRLQRGELGSCAGAGCELRAATPAPRHRRASDEDTFRANWSHSRWRVLTVHAKEAWRIV